MLVLSRFLLFFVMLCILIVYIFANIKHIGEGSEALVILTIAIMLGFFLLALELLKKQNIYIKKSSLFLILFFTYFIFNIMLNRPDDIVSLTLATTGGIFLFYILGVLVSLNLVYIKDRVLISNQFLKFFIFFYFLFSILFIFLLTDTFLSLMENIREDLFLISDLNGAYQRPGAFLVISFYIYSFMTAFFLFSNKKAKKKMFSKLINFFFFIVYCLSAIGGMLLSQLIASNNSFVNIGGLLFATTIFYILINFTKSEQILRYIRLNFSKIFLSKISKKLFLSIFLSLVLVIILLVGLINIYDIDLDKFRIFGFGRGDVSSVSSRIEKWNNFPLHFGYNPIFGNMAVDSLTTGEGTYVHSFVGSLLTHLGIVGFILFFIYLFKAVNERFRSYDNLYFNNLYALYSIVVFVGIFAIATFGTFLTWISFWFLLGLIFPPISFKNRKEKTV